MEATFYRPKSIYLIDKSNEKEPEAKQVLPSLNALPYKLFYIEDLVKSLKDQIKLLESHVEIQKEIRDLEKRVLLREKIEWYNKYKDLEKRTRSANRERAKADPKVEENSVDGEDFEVQTPKKKRRSSGPMKKQGRTWKIPKGDYL